MLYRTRVYVASIIIKVSNSGHQVARAFGSFQLLGIKNHSLPPREALWNAQNNLLHKTSVRLKLRRMSQLPSVFPNGVDKTTALLDLLAGWRNKIDLCREIKKKELKRRGITRAEWEVHHSEAYADLAYDLYQAAGKIMLLPEEDQDAATQKFFTEHVLVLFSSTTNLQSP